MHDLNVRRVDPQQGYDLWAETYESTPNPVVSMDARYTPQLLAPKPGEAVLDAGCGTGRHLHSMVARGSIPVGVDFSLGMLKVAHQRLPNVALVQASLEQRLPFAADCFELALCALVGEHLGDLPSVFREIYRVIEPGGRFVFSVYHPEMAAAGSEARFQRSGVEYRLGAIVYTLDDYRNSLQEAGFRQLVWHEFRGDQELVAAVPHAAKYLGSPVLLLIETTKSR